VKKIQRLYRIGVLAAAILLAIGVLPETGITEAGAVTFYDYYCTAGQGDVGCLNAWGGGPSVKVETDSGPGIQNNRFQVLPVGNGNYQIQFIGGGTYNNDCIGDDGNISGNAAAGLVPCNTHTAAGWGTIFRDRSNLCKGGLVAYYDSHWRGYIGPQMPFVNGTKFYLNNLGLVCFLIVREN
jgi:hypothetical protein